jgi:F-type H+-transporting ATPase subunit b
VEAFFEQFGVNWKLLIAQVVNFLLLLFILKRFAYGPIIQMLNDRRKKIDEGMKASADAKKRLAEANETRMSIILKAEEESVGIVSRAELTAKNQAQAIVDEAHHKTDEIITAGQKKIEEDRLKLEEEVFSQAQELVKKGLVVTLGKINPTERDEALIKEALRELTTVRS